MQQAMKRSLRRFIIILSAFLLFIFCFLMVVAERFVEPILRDRLHTLIIEGSDSLYTYKLGNLDASFFGGNVEVHDSGNHLGQYSLSNPKTTASPAFAYHAAFYGKGLYQRDSYIFPGVQ
jgi:hypothetical protein